uniref:Uncharacterized protein n=1 Tax=Nelumbo nucifera TaxID=4432 RepID=A0A822YF35_NELNU|nr:TPA_asm: hypothetical protein HUJ06_011635 [Nelumbo nucifera]
MACNEEDFCSNRLVLKPQEAGLVDLIYLLWSSDIENRRFVDYSEETRITEFRHRWLIFLSVLLQKVLLSIVKPMPWVGSLFEKWLNLLSSNRGLAVLFHYR